MTDVELQYRDGHYFAYWKNGHPLTARECSTVIAQWLDHQVTMDDQESHVHDLDNDQQPVPEMGAVYLLRAKNGLYKIGETVDLKRGLKELERRWRGEWEHVLVCAIQCDDTWELEGQLHDLFRNKRSSVLGDWFALSPKDVQYIKSLAE